MMAQMPKELIHYRNLAVPGGATDLDCPALVWESYAEAERSEEDQVFSTRSSSFTTRPRRGEPLVFELRKGTAKLNAFAMGITVGRADSNDVSIDDVSVSRFHAYFQQDSMSGEWKLFDAESRNGTWLGPLKLQGKIGQRLADQVSLRFGLVQLKFYEPKSFTAFVRARLGS
jgi:hypothetical protein